MIVNEFDQVKLTCKVRSEPNQSQISWRREDLRPIEGLEQRFKHQFKRLPSIRMFEENANSNEDENKNDQNNNNSSETILASIDSSDLIIDAIRRDQAGAYLVSFISLLLLLLLV